MLGFNKKPLRHVLQASLYYDRKRVRARANPPGLLSYQRLSSHVKLLLHFDTDFSDESADNHTPTLFSTPVISSAQKVFGAASMLTSTSNMVTYPTSTGFNIFDSVPAQITMRLYRNSSASTQVFLATLGDWAGNGYLFFMEPGSSIFKISSNSAVRATWTSAASPLNTWQEALTNLG